jgi:GAF domain-containing protein
MTLLRRAWAPSPPDDAELVPLSERALHLSIARGSLALVIVASAALMSAPSVHRTALAVSAVAYGAVCASPLALRRLGRNGTVRILQASLLLDGIYLAYVMYATGGTTSPLRVLVGAHLVAVTLTTTYRTGMKIALWHTLLYLLLLHAEAGTLPAPIAPPPSAPGAGAASGFSAGLWITGLWMVAGSAAAFSALNERTLRAQKRHLQQLSAMTAEMERSENASDVARILLDRVMHTFRFPRAALLASRDGDPRLLASAGMVGRSAPRLGLDPLMERALEQRQVVLVRRLDVERNPRLARLFPDARNVLIVPLILPGGSRIGVLAVEHTASDAIAAWIVAMVEQFAAHAALALHNAWFAEALRQSVAQIASRGDDFTARDLRLEPRIAEQTS